MKAGTSTTSDKPKRGRPSTKTAEDMSTLKASVAEKQHIDEPEVIKTHENLDSVVTMALNSGKKKLLVTANVLKNVLQNRYKDDAYMVYRNVELHDVEKHEATMKTSKMTTNDKVFGHSKVGIASNPAPLVK